MDKIAVLIPCYNERQTIREVVEGFKRSLPDSVIYVYDNNSTDGTDTEAVEAGAVVRYEYQQGKGNVIRRMFREIVAECYVMVDGDNTYSPDDAPDMVQKVLMHNADMVVGDRLSSTYFEENKRPFHNLGNSLVRKAINGLFHTAIKDIMTGYRAFSYQFVKTFPVLSTGFEIETEMTIHAVYNNFQVENQIIQYSDRPAGSESKLNTYSDGMKVLRTIIRMFRQYRPLKFFGCLSLFLFLISIAFFIPLVIEFLKTGLVPKIPTLIVCCFSLLAATISFFSGLILQNLEKKDRRDNEFKRQIICMITQL